MLQSGTEPPPGEKPDDLTRYVPSLKQLISITGQPFIYPGHLTRDNNFQ
jgi:hypothetical protein